MGTQRAIAQLFVERCREVEGRVATQSRWNVNFQFAVRTKLPNKFGSLQSIVEMALNPIQTPPKSISQHPKTSGLRTSVRRKNIPPNKFGNPQSIVEMALALP